MIEDIMGIKDDAMRQLEKRVGEGRLERMDVKELADVIKDLAEAAKACTEAEYYMLVADAMEEGAMGYEDGMGYAKGGRGGSGYQRREGGSGYPRGGRGRDSMGRYTSRSGYQKRYGHDDMMQEVREMMQTADPQERERLKQQLRQMTQEM